MHYLYGDATPFPLDDNFVDTLVAATEACVALLRLDDIREDLQRRKLELVERARREQDKLTALGVAVESTLATRRADDRPNTGAQLAVRRLEAETQAILKSTGDTISRRRDAALRRAEEDDPGSAVLEVLSNFLRDHQLPDTTWRLRWRANVDGAPQAHLHASTPVGLQALFDTQIPSDHVLGRAVRLDALGVVEAMVLPIERGKLRRGTRMSLQRLARWYVTEVVRSPERRSMVIARSPDDEASRIEIVIDSRDRTEPTLRRTGAGAEEGREVGFRAGDLEPVLAMWSGIDGAINDLVNQRHRVIVANLEMRPIDEPARPRRLAQAIIDAVGPLAREMRRRSREPGEITLKRELGDGRREELFVAEEELASKLAPLRDDQRALFDVYGLDDTAESAATPVPVGYHQEARLVPVGYPKAARLLAGRIEGEEDDGDYDVRKLDEPTAFTGEALRGDAAL